MNESPRWGLPLNFAGLEPEFSSFESSRVAVLPVPYDFSTSYQGGTRWGPQAILTASRNIEVWDDELGSTYQAGIHTLPELESTALGPGDMARRVEAARPAARAADVLERLTTSVARDVTAALDEHSANRVLAHMDPQRAATLLASMPEDVRDRALAEMPVRVVSELRELMTFPPDSAGALMNPRITMTFRPEQTVRDVVLRLRQIRRRRVNQIYLVDENGRLTAIIPLQTVILAGARDRLGELSRARLVAVRVSATREDIIETIAGSTLTALPVVDYEGRLVGAIRQDVLVSTASEGSHRRARGAGPRLRSRPAPGSTAPCARSTSVHARAPRAPLTAGRRTADPTR